MPRDKKNGSTQIRTGVLRTRISYAAPTPWNLSMTLCCSLFSSWPDWLVSLKRGHNRIRTNDRRNCSPTLYHWAMHPVILFPCFPLCKKTPPVGLEPTTLRLKAARSTDWARRALILLPYSAFSFSLWRMTTWPSGLRRVTRNHFSSGGVGSNPAVVVFCRLFCFLNTIIVQKMVPPRFELGSWEPESHMLPLHHGTLVYIIPTPRWYSPAFIFFLFLTHILTRVPTIHTYIPTYTYTHSIIPTYLPDVSVRHFCPTNFSPLPLIFLSCLPDLL